jgi:hypothetical protein
MDSPSSSSSSAPATPIHAVASGRPVPLCRAAELSVSIGRNGPANGTVGVYFLFRNVSTNPCDVSGWPKVVGIGSTTSPTTAVNERQLIGMAAITGEPTIRLAGSVTATAVLAGSDNPGPSGDCATPFRRLQVSTPDGALIGDLSAFVPNLAADMPNCAGLLVSMFVPTTAVNLGG